MGTAPTIRIDKARRALASARMLLQAGDTEGACNRAYYAMFYAAHDALENAGVIEPGATIKTHHGLISIVSRELVLTAKVGENLGRALARVHHMRLLADYEGERLEAADALWAIEQAEEFVAEMQV